MKKGLAIGTLASVLAVGLIAWRFWPHPTAHEQSAELGQGGRIILRAATYGTKHFSPDEPWGRFQVMVPMGLRSKLRIPTPAVTQTEVPSIACWFESKNRPSNVQMLNCVFVDEHGVEGGFPTFLYTAPSGPANLEALGTTVFPRRQKEITIRLSYVDGNFASTFLKDFKLRNPGYRKYPSWDPEPYPVKKKDGDLEVTLTELARRGYLRKEVEPRFEVRQRGQITTQWRPEAIEMSDATGNFLEVLLSRGLKGNSCWTSATLWPSESAWRLRVEFSRDQGADFTPEELWTVKGIKVSDGNIPTPIDVSTNWHGTTVSRSFR